MITNKLDVSRLLLTKKNTHRVPLYEKEGAKVVSSLPPSHLNIVDRRLTFYGSQKDVNLSFEKKCCNALKIKNQTFISDEIS